MCKSMGQMLKLKVVILCVYRQIYLLWIQYKYKAQTSSADCLLSEFKHLLNA